MNSVLSDPELISAVRNGDISAYAGLYSRHAHAAHRLARVLTHDADELQRLVSDSFARVRLDLLSGGGPAVIFRTYLLTTLLDVHYVQLLRRLEGKTPQPRKEPLVGLVDTTELVVPTGSLIAEAVSRVPARWQLVLWHVEVERESAFLVGAMLGLGSEEVSTLAIRAQDRLRTAYLSEMEEHALTAECSWATQRLAAGISEPPYDPDQERLDNHVAACEGCHQRFPEFYRLERRMTDVLGPLVLGDLADPYSSGDIANVSAAGLAGSPRRWWGRLPWIGVVSAAVAGAAAAVVLLPAAVTGSAGPKEVANTTAPTPLPSKDASASDTADVTVSLRGTLERGRTTQLGIQVANAGPASSGTVTLVLTLPTGAAVRGNLPGPWQCSGRTTTLVCTHPSLTAGERTAGAVIVSVQPAAPLGGRAVAVVSPAQADPVRNNNRAETPLSAPPPRG